MLRCILLILLAVAIWAPGLPQAANPMLARICASIGNNCWASARGLARRDAALVWAVLRYPARQRRLGPALIHVLALAIMVFLNFRARTCFRSPGGRFDQ